MSHCSYWFSFLWFTPLPPASKGADSGFCFCLKKFPILPVRWSNGMRCRRSDWPGLFLFCCYQPLCVVSQQSRFGLFLFHKFSNFTSPPPQARRTRKATVQPPAQRHWNLLLKTFRKWVMECAKLWLFRSVLLRLRDFENPFTPF